MMIYSILIVYIGESRRLVPIVSQIIPVHVISSHLCKIKFNIIPILCLDLPSRPFSPIFYSLCVYQTNGYARNTWVISKVLHVVCFLFKNEFILQNTFTGLQYNLHCALSQWSNVWASLVFLSGRLRC
jgi:hypothetical protein